MSPIYNSPDKYPDFPSEVQNEHGIDYYPLDAENYVYNLLGGWGTPMEDLYGWTVDQFSSVWSVDPIASVKYSENSYHVLQSFELLRVLAQNLVHESSHESLKTVNKVPFLVYSYELPFRLPARNIQLMRAEMLGEINPHASLEKYPAILVGEPNIVVNVDRCPVSMNVLFCFHGRPLELSLVEELFHEDGVIRKDIWESIALWINALSNKSVVQSIGNDIALGRESFSLVEGAGPGLVVRPLNEEGYLSAVKAMANNPCFK